MRKSPLIHILILRGVLNSPKEAKTHQGYELHWALAIGLIKADITGHKRDWPLPFHKGVTSIALGDCENVSELNTSNLDIEFGTLLRTKRIS